MRDEIYSCIPVNRSAAVVTSQKRCEDELTQDQVRENLVAKVKSLDVQLLSYPKNHPARKRLGIEKHELCQKINKLPNKKRLGDLGRFIGVAAKEQLSSFEWERIKKRAVELKKLAESGGE